jgi:hypothetical protein
MCHRTGIVGVMPADSLTDDLVFRGAIVALRKLRATEPGDTLYGAHCAAANAWVNEAHERLQRLEKEGNAAT